MITHDQFDPATVALVRQRKRHIRQLQQQQSAHQRTKHQRTPSENNDSTIDKPIEVVVNDGNEALSDIASVSSLPWYARYVLRWLPPPLVTIISEYVTPCNRVAALWSDICMVAGIEQSICGASQQRLDDLQRDWGHDLPLHPDLRALLQISDGVYDDQHPISVWYPSIMELRQQSDRLALCREMKWNPFGIINDDIFKVIDYTTGGIYIIDTKDHHHTVVTTSLCVMMNGYHQLLCQYGNDTVTLQQQRRRAMQRIQHRHFQATADEELNSEASEGSSLVTLERAESAARLEASLAAASLIGPRVDDNVLQSQLRGCQLDDPPLTLGVASPSVAAKLNRVINPIKRRSRPGV